VPGLVQPLGRHHVQAVHCFVIHLFKFCRHLVLPLLQFFRGGIYGQLPVFGPHLQFCVQVFRSMSAVEISLFRGGPVHAVQAFGHPFLNSPIGARGRHHKNILSPAQGGLCGCLLLSPGPAAFGLQGFNIQAHLVHLVFQHLQKPFLFLPARFRQVWVVPADVFDNALVSQEAAPQPVQGFFVNFNLPGQGGCLQFFQGFQQGLFQQGHRFG